MRGEFVKQYEIDEKIPVGKVGSFIQIGIVFFGLLIAASGMVSAENLAAYPEPFIDGDGQVDSTIVVGADAAAGEVIGAANIAASLAKAAEDPVNSVLGDGNSIDVWESDMAVTDEDPGLEQRMEEDHMVLVGNPSVNSLTAELAEQERTFSSDSFSEGEAAIHLVEDAFQGNDALVIAGYSEDETRDAANFVASYEENGEEFNGEIIRLMDGEVVEQE